MQKPKFISAALVTLSVLILVGVIMIYFLLNSQREQDMICIELAEEKCKTVSFEAPCLIPGSSSEYKISLLGKIEDDYRVTLGFSEEAALLLGQYACIRIETEEGVLCDAPLASVLDRSDLFFDCHLTRGEGYHIKIIYYMPVEVGNEAQKTEADFILTFTASSRREQNP